MYVPSSKIRGLHKPSWDSFCYNKKHIFPGLVIDKLILLWRSYIPSQNVVF